METNLSFTLDHHFIRTKAGHAEQLYSGGRSARQNFDI